MHSIASVVDEAYQMCERKNHITLKDFYQRCTGLNHIIAPIFPDL